MIYDILFAVCGIGLIALGLSLMKLDKLVRSWMAEVLDLTKVINAVDRRQFEGSLRLDEAFQRIQVLEDRLEGQEALTANLEDKIKALEETVEYLEGKL